MADQKSNGTIKRKSKGMRKHLRRVKEESRKAGTPIGEWKKKVRQQPVPKK